MAKFDTSFQRLCHEAVIACGADFTAIERYVLDRIEMMDVLGRERIKRDLQLVLGFKPQSWSADFH